MIAWLVPLVSAAAAPFDRTLDASPDVVVSISVDCGTLRVVGQEGGKVHVSGTIEGDGSVDAALASGRATVATHRPHPRGDDEDCAELTVGVPPTATVDVLGESVTVQVDGVTGPTSVQTVSGDVVVSGAPQCLTARTVSGDVAVSGAAARVDVSTVSGDVGLRGVGGTIKLATVSGDLALSAGLPLASVDAETVSGDVALDAALAPGGRVQAASHSGDVALRCPADTDAALAITTFSGDVTNGFGTTTLGAGHGRIELSTFSGDVEVQALRAPSSPGLPR